MNSPIANSFSKKERLCGKTSIASLIRRGRWVVCNHIRACYVAAPEEQECSRIIVSVPKKYFKRAVKRNLLKRRMREVYRTSKGTLGEKKINLMLVWSCKELGSIDVVREETQYILNKINK